MTSIFEKTVVYQIQGMDQTVITRDIPYSRKNIEYCLLDVYGPKSSRPGERFPAVIFVHGGPVSTDWGINLKDIGQYNSYGRLLAASGYVAITFNHRLFDLNSYPKSEVDLLQVIEYIRVNSDLYAINPESICVWFISYGCPLLAVLLRSGLDFLRCFVAYYGPLDVLPSDQPSSKLLFEGYSPVSILSSLSKFNRPIFIAKAGMDDKDLNATIDTFVSKADLLKKPVKLITHETGQHAFDILDDDDRSRSIIKATIDFIDENTIAG